MENEVKVLDSYLRGNFCGFILKDENDEVLDSAWGFEDSESAMIEAKLVADSWKIERHSMEVHCCQLHLNGCLKPNQLHVIPFIRQANETKLKGE